MNSIEKSERGKAIKFYNEFVQYLGNTDLGWENQGNKYWTETIMNNVLNKMAKKSKLRPYSMYLNGEYMIDMCWANEKPNVYYLDTAIEQEWNDDDKNDFLWDFYKLVDIKSILKVFIISPRHNLRYWMKEFKKIIKNNPLKLKEEVYLILSLTEAENDYTEVKGYIIDKLGDSEYLDTKVC